MKKTIIITRDLRQRSSPLFIDNPDDIHRHPIIKRVRAQSAQRQRGAWWRARVCRKVRACVREMRVCACAACAKSKKILIRSIITDITIMRARGARARLSADARRARAQQQQHSGA